MKHLKKYIVIVLAVCFALLASACAEEDFGIIDPSDVIEDASKTLGTGDAEAPEENESEAEPDGENGDGEQDPGEDDDGENPEDDGESEESEESSEEATSTLPTEEEEEATDPSGDGASKVEKETDYDWTPFY